MVETWNLVHVEAEGTARWVWRFVQLSMLMSRLRVVHTSIRAWTRQLACKGGRARRDPTRIRVGIRLDQSITELCGGLGCALQLSILARWKAGIDTWHGLLSSIVVKLSIIPENTKLHVIYTLQVILLSSCRI